jgi:hypothetical protein
MILLAQEQTLLVAVAIAVIVVSGGPSMCAVLFSGQPVDEGTYAE